MTLRELLEETGGEHSRIACSVLVGTPVVAWTGAGRDNAPGWWWAIVSTVGAHEPVLARGWTRGLRVVQRDADIAAALLTLARGEARAVA